MSERTLVEDNIGDVLKVRFVRDDDTLSNVRVEIVTDVRVRGDLRERPHRAQKPEIRVFHTAERLMHEIVKALQNQGVAVGWEAPDQHDPIRSQQHFQLSANILVGQSKDDEQLTAVYSVALENAKKQLGYDRYGNTSDKQAGKML